MKTYFNEFGDLIEDPSAVLGPNVYVYSTRRGDFVFPIEHRLPLITAEEKEGDAHVPAQE